MKVTVARASINKAIAQCMSIVDVRASNEAIRRLKLDVADGRLRVTGSNGYVTIRASLEAAIETAGSYCVDAKLAREIFSSLPGASGDVSLSVDKHTMQIRCGKRKSEIDVRDGDEFPNLAVGPEEMVRLAGPSLAHAMALVNHAADRDETNPVASCIDIACGSGKIAAQAADRHRGARVVMECPAGEFHCLVPAPAIRVVRKVLAESGTCDAEIGATAEEMRLRCGIYDLTAKLSASVFPDLPAYIPADAAQPVNVDRGLLLDAVRGMAPTSSQETDDGKVRWGEIELTFADGEIRIAAVNQRGKSTDTVECDYAGDTIGMVCAPHYLIDLLAAETADEVSLHPPKGDEPMKITPRLTRESVYVLMPMNKRRVA
jgi:DNA polymerase III beta subunit